MPASSIAFQASDSQILNQDKVKANVIPFPSFAHLFHGDQLQLHRTHLTQSQDFYFIGAFLFRLDVYTFLFV
jgi:hypothetical protein